MLPVTANFSCIIAASKRSYLQADGGDEDGEREAQLRHSFIDIMKRFDLRNHLTPELKTQYAKSEEKNHFDERLKADAKEEVQISQKGNL